MIINGEESININGIDYWTLKQFSYLTNRGDASIKQLIRFGNRIRKLKILKIDNKTYIEAKELFEFPFIIIGRPSSEAGAIIEKFKVNKSNELIRTEETYNNAH